MNERERVLFSTVVYARILNWQIPFMVCSANDKAELSNSCFFGQVKIFALDSN